MTVETPPRGVPLPEKPSRPPNRRRKIRDPNHTAASESDWRHQAACRNYDPELWFSEAPFDRAHALDICHYACDVQEQCLAFAKASGASTGIWGGVQFYGRH